MESLNQSLALVLWSQDRDGNDDVAVFSGILVEEAGVYYLARENGVRPEMRREWLPRIQAVPEDLKETLLGCDYQLSLSVGDIEGAESFADFGLKWPK